MTAWLDCRDPEELSAWLEGVIDCDDLDDPPEDPVPAPAPRAPPPWHLYDSETLFAAPFEAPRMLVPELDLGPGRPCGLWGAPSSGKTCTAQAIALAVASGAPTFGCFATTRGRVLHLTYDSGLRAVSLRYRQIANGMGLDPSALAGRIVVAVHPTIALTSPGAWKAFHAVLSGFDLAILDNVREAIPRLDENDSQFGGYLTAFGSACEAHGCTALYLHHTRKDATTLDAGSGRGTGAVLAASGTVWGLEVQGDGARRMKPLRAHDMSDELKAAFTIERVYTEPGAFDVGSAESWTLDATGSTARRGDLSRRVLTVITGTPGIGLRALRDAVGGKHDATDAALAGLIAIDAVEDRGGEGRSPRSFYPGTCAP